MSAGLSPEGFQDYVGQIRLVAEEVLEVIEEYPIRMAAPSLIMAMVSVALGLAEEHGTDFSDHIKMMQEGLATLASDVKREENAHGN